MENETYNIRNKINFCANVLSIIDNDNSKKDNEYRDLFKSNMLQAINSELSNELKYIETFQESFNNFCLTYFDRSDSFFDLVKLINIQISNFLKNMIEEKEGEF